MSKIEPDTSEPVKYTGSEGQNKDENALKDTQEPPQASDKADTQGSSGKWSQKTVKTTVTRMPCREPFSGHPKQKLGNPKDGSAGRGDPGKNG